jgi:uncharacterized delta-60 repeat protein
MGLVAASALPAAAAAGNLDPTFDHDGKVRTGLSVGGSDVAIQSDGKVVAVGSRGNDFAVVRFNRDGSLDQTFGSGGMAVVAPGVHRESSASGVALRNGKIVVVGSSFANRGSGPEAMAVARLNSDGTVDTTFGSGPGEGFLIRIGSGTSGNDVAIQSNGRIVALGAAPGGFAVVRLTSAGVLDPSFSGNGWTTTDFPQGIDASAVAVDPVTQRIVAGGFEVDNGGFSHNFALVSYTTTGHLDTSFNSTGKMVRATSSAGGLGDLAVLGDSSIVAVGQTLRGGFGNVMLIEKYRPSGAFATGFGGGDGIVTVGFGSHTEHRDTGAGGVAIQNDGKIVVAGTSTGVDKRFALVRLTAAGALDLAFGNNGAVLTGFSRDADGNAVAINRGTGKIVVVGDELTPPPTIGVDALLAARYMGS